VALETGTTGVDVGLTGLEMVHGQSGCHVSFQVDASHDGEMHTGDGEGFRGSSRVCLGALGEGCGLRAEGCVDISGYCGPDSVVRPCLSSGDEAEDGEDGLSSLHVGVERLYDAVTRVG
jgi:hypothetical protein